VTRPPTNDGPATRGSAQAEGLSSHVLNRINRNSAFLIVGQLGARMISFAYILVLARYLGVDDFGQYNLVMTFVLVAITAVDFGLTRLIVRDLSREPERIPEYLATLLPLRASLAVAGYLGLLAAVWLAGYSGHTLMLAAIAAGALLPTSIGLVFDALFHAGQQMLYSAAGDVVIALAQCLIGAMVMLAGGGVEALLATGVATALSYMLFLGRQAHSRGYPIRARLDRRLCTQLLRQAAPFALATLLAILATRAELLLLGRLSAAENVGLFSAASRFTETALLLPTVLASAVAPVIAQFHAGSREHLRDVYVWTIRRMLFVTLPLALTGVVLAGGILGLLFPRAYQQATPVLQLLFCAFPFASLQIINSVILTMSSRPRLMIVNSVVATTTQFAMGLLIIPRYGLIGAAVSALVSQVSIVAFSYWCVRRWFVDTTGLGRLAAAPACAAALAAAVAAASLERWGAWSLVPVLGAYAAALGILTALWPPPKSGGTAELG
jgi:O-antigen/teichoic acid export membrane protein